MSNRTFALSLATSLLVVAAACNGVSAGVVIEKDYDDPDSWVSSRPVYRQQCRSVLRRTTYVNDCTQVFSHNETEQHYDGPHWSLRLRATDGKTGWVEVDETTYHDTRIGGRYP